jgi:hypothetical protein
MLLYDFMLTGFKVVKKSLSVVMSFLSAVYLERKRSEGSSPRTPPPPTPLACLPAVVKGGEGEPGPAPASTSGKECENQVQSRSSLQACRRSPSGTESPAVTQLRGGRGRVRQYGRRPTAAAAPALTPLRGLPPHRGGRALQRGAQAAHPQQNPPR